MINDLTKAVIELNRSILETFITESLEASTNRASEIAGMLRALLKLRQLLYGVKDDGVAKAAAQMSAEMKTGLLRIGEHIARSAVRARAEQNTAHVAQLESLRLAFASLGEVRERGI